MGRLLRRMPRTPRASAWETNSMGVVPTQRTTDESPAMDLSLDSVAKVTAPVTSRRTTLGRRVWTCSIKASRSVKAADSVMSSRQAITVWRPAVRMGCSEYNATLVIFHSPRICYQHASGGAWSGIRRHTDFRKIDPACLRRRPHYMGGSSQGDYCLVLCKIRVCRDSVARLFDANLTLEANTHMQAELRKRKSETELAPLYWRRNTLRLLIRSLERYQIGTRHGQRCSRRKQLAAA